MIFEHKNEGLLVNGFLSCVSFYSGTRFNQHYVGRNTLQRKGRNKHSVKWCTSIECFDILN